MIGWPVRPRPRSGRGQRAVTASVRTNVLEWHGWDPPSQGLRRDELYGTDGTYKSRVAGGRGVLECGKSETDYCFTDY